MIYEIKRTLLIATIALAVPMGMLASTATHASVDMFLKLGDIEGEAVTASANKELIQVESVDQTQKKATGKHKIKIKGNTVILRKPGGKFFRVLQGRFRLPSGMVILIKHGRIVKRTPTRSRKVWRRSRPTKAGTRKLNYVGPSKK